jgi:hypothetical protein
LATRFFKGKIMEIRILKTTHVRGVPRHEGEVVEVTAAEARQFITGGCAEDVSHKDKPLANKSAKAIKKR